MKTRFASDFEVQTPESVARGLGIAKRLIPVKEITITRAEGPNLLCGRTFTAHSFSEAAAWLISQAGTFPATGGYDKHDFKITWEDGETYSGQLDCKAEGCPDPDLDVFRHVFDEALFWTGRRCPAHMTPENYEAFLGREEKDSPGTRATWEKFMNDYLFNEEGWKNGA